MESSVASSGTAGNRDRLVRKRANGFLVMASGILVWGIGTTVQHKVLPLVGASPRWGDVMDGFIGLGMGIWFAAGILVLVYTRRLRADPGFHGVFRDEFTRQLKLRAAAVTCLIVLFSQIFMVWAVAVFPALDRLPASLGAYVTLMIGLGALIISIALFGREGPGR